MDEPSLKENSGNESQNDEDEANEEQELENEWQINPNDEKLSWYKELLNKYFYVHNICPKSNKNTFRINGKKAPHLLNSLYLNCSNKILNIKEIC